MNVRLVVLALASFSAGASEEIVLEKEVDTDHILPLSSG
ncbi:hypothetical protein U27_06449 [Candidatus Vecturithrix granuli]|uniref:Uncharacterized protein n=1 Tax=Vecturithrix granuli TaxID=1499967 RepID=A0A081C4F9_VECG1|nr:hypothetical protein U27_06449 [Candidatus Vecturithrix granuli]